ncbi:ABC transporter ATP-binding protein [Terasakiella sp. A23]|uniref:ABC transporter ATP-binding protein n=1 Tax=Terasakiella sp. FCG-A23 TaxID=3080561 RepID=UPI002953CAB4|nr:ABC transporter ATP-binding protein [Terasakiella sp. A23]MDV7339349.1 ABC transporter ATP-binding protein [Terasakiella sp. A23]
MTDILCAEQLCYTYKTGKEALKEVSFSVRKGAFCALLGPNGAGKSTFFSLASALIKPGQGGLRICGHDVAKNRTKALAKLGLVFQQTTLDLDLTVAQNLRYFASLHGISSKQANMRIQEELERLNLFDRANEKVRLLNGGHRRRVEIARALLHEPDALLLDEATVGLDVKTRADLVKHVHSLCQDNGVGVLWATHLIDEIEDTDDVVILHQGNVVAQGRADELADPALEETFHKLTGASGA